MFRVDHDCEINVKRDEILFMPGKGPLRTIGMAFRHACMASHNNPTAKRYLRSRASITYEKRRHLRNYKGVIHPFSLMRHWWDYVMILTMAGGLLIFPYEAAFEMYSTSNTHSRVWETTKILITFLFCADIVMNLITGYYDLTLRAVQLEQRRIMIRYIFHGTFFPDLIGSIPTELFFIAQDRTSPIVVCEVLNMLKIFRLFSMYSYIERLARTYDIPQVLYEFTNLIFWSVYVMHWQACIHYIVPIAVASLGKPVLPDSNSWIVIKGLWKKDSQRRYTQSLFRAVAIFTRSGFGDVDLITREDQCLVLITEVFGSLVFCILVARIMQMLKGAHSSKLKYQAMQAQLKEYMRNQQLSSTTQQRFLTYYDFRFQNCYFRESEILNTVSGQIRQEIGMHSCRKLVENVTFFNNLPMSLLIRIVALLRSEIFLTNDVIVRVNQPGDCMYFIASGTVAIYTTSGKEVCHLEDGAHFGEIALVMPDERRVASVVAVEVCELYRLERADFARTIHPYPMLWERIKKIAMERNERTTSLNAQ